MQAIVYNPTNLNNIIVLEENEVVITTDNFETWQHYVYDMSEVEGYSYGLTASFNPFNSQEIFINADWYPQFSTDGGATMTRFKNPFFATTGSVNFTVSPEEHLYYSVQYGYVHREMATGIDTPHDVKRIDYMGMGDSGNEIVTEKTMPGRVYTFAKSIMGSSLKVSDDHGTTSMELLQVFASKMWTVETDPNNANVLFSSFSAGEDEFLLFRIDYSNPSDIIVDFIQLPFADHVTGIQFENGSSDNILISIGTRIYKSTDAGATWVLSNTGLEDLITYYDLIYDLKANPLNDDQFTLASTQGVFTSYDRGATWTKLYDGFVYNIEHSDKVNGHIIGTVPSSTVSDFKIIYSSNSGETWSDVKPKELYYMTAAESDYRFFDESAEVYIGSADLGLVKYDISLDPVGVERINAPKMQVQVYPNPASTQIKIITDADYKEIEMYNSKGQLVLTSNVNTIDVSKLEKGLYMVKTISNDGYSDYQKVIVQNLESSGCIYISI